MSKLVKLKICLICDARGWAFDIIANQLKKDLRDRYEIRIDYFDMYNKPEELYEVIERNLDCDLIHFFWRKSLLLLDSLEFKGHIKGDFEEFIKKLSSKLSTGVYDFLYLDEENILKYQDIFNKYTCTYYVSSKKLYKEYIKVKEYKKPYGVVHDVIDYSNLKPLNLERFENLNRTFVVGWVGNSARKVNDIDLKGLNTIIKPVIDELVTEGYDIKGYYADRNEKLRSRKEMLDYYKEIDVCLCTSIHEGTPLPVLEAMYCGIPIVTTDVGVVKEVLGPKEQEYIIGERQNGLKDEEVKKKLKAKLKELYNNREILEELSQENRESIEKYDGGKLKEEFANYLEYALNDKVGKDE